MHRIGIAALLAAGMTAPALAGVSVSIPLETEQGGNFTTAEYSCGGEDAFAVQYINAGPQSFALVPVDGQQRVFVNVIAASGARYVSGRFEWWTKGDEATLTDRTDEAAARHCETNDDPTPD